MGMLAIQGMIAPKPIVDEGSFFVDFEAMIPRMANVPTYLTRHV